MQPGSHWRDAKKPNREEKEKLKNNFSTFERRKRNLNSISQFREEKGKSKFLCLVSRGEREISNFLAQFREEKEKPEFIFPVSRGEREILNSFAQFREEKEKLANILNFWEEKFKTNYLWQSLGCCTILSLMEVRFPKWFLRVKKGVINLFLCICLLYTSPSPRD